MTDFITPATAETQSEMNASEGLPTNPRFSGSKDAFKEECKRRRQAGLTLTGNTYPAKDAIKAAGGIWDRRAQGWLMPDADTYNALDAYCRTLPVEAPRARRNPRPNYGNRARVGRTARQRCEDAPCCGCCDAYGNPV